jgi:hypothetical protein
MFWPLSFAEESFFESPSLKDYKTDLFCRFREKLIDLAYSHLSPNLSQNNNNNTINQQLGVGNNISSPSPLPSPLSSLPSSFLNENNNNDINNISIPSNWEYFRELLVVDSASPMIDQERRRSFPVFTLLYIQDLAKMCLVGENEVPHILDLLSSWGEIILIHSSFFSNHTPSVDLFNNNINNINNNTNNNNNSNNINNSKINHNNNININAANDNQDWGNDYIILRPHWLIDIFKLLISVKYQLPSHSFKKKSSSSSPSAAASYSSKTGMKYEYQSTLSYDQLFQRYVESFKLESEASNLKSVNNDDDDVHDDAAAHQLRYHLQLQKIIELWYHLQLFIPLTPRLYLILPLLPKHPPPHMQTTLHSLSSTTTTKISGRGGGDDVIIMRRTYELQYFPNTLFTRILFEVSQSPSPSYSLLLPLLQHVLNSIFLPKNNINNIQPTSSPSPSSSCTSSPSLFCLTPLVALKIVKDIAEV